MGKEHDDLFGGRVDASLVISGQISQHNRINFQRDEARNGHKESGKAIEINLTHFLGRCRGSKDTRNCPQGQDNADDEGSSDGNGEGGNDGKKPVSAAKERDYQDQL